MPPLPWESGSIRLFRLQGLTPRYVGNAVHAFLGCDLRHTSPTQEEEIAEDLLDGHGAGGSIQPSDLVALADRFKGFVENRWPNAQLHREWPISMRFEGHELHGTADLVVETGKGYVIIDHKTFPGGEKELADKAKTFAAQLVAYKEALLAATGRPVIGTLIHFPVSGFVAVVAIDNPDQVLMQSLAQTDLMPRSRRFRH
jgi:ATP-dependent helicase/nuclease subunit A